MRPTTPSRLSPTPLSPIVGSSAHVARLTGAATPRGTPIQTIPLPANRSTAHQLSFANDSDVSMVGVESSASHIESIIPFHLDLSERLLASAGVSSSTQQPGNPQSSVSGVHLTKDQLLQLQIETTEYIDNLDLTLRTLFSHDNARLRQTIVNTSEMPVTFMYLRLQQQMLKLSGDYSGARERGTLNKLAQLLDS